MSAQWRYLDRAEAQGRPLYGFGGSLIVAYGFAAFLLAWQLFGGLNPDGEGLAKMYGSADNAAIMRVVLIIKAFLWLPFLMLAPLKYPLMRQVALVCIGATFLLDAVVINIVLGLPAAKAMGVNGFNLIVALAFAGYFLRSKRANLTFSLRERV
jgi:hypothetical protein